MKATLSTLPPDDGNWAYEIKWDGYRTLAFVDDGRVRLQSSNLLDVTAKWPELGDLADGVPAGRAILDGELVVLDDDGRPRFELIQRHERQAAYYIFDVLSIEGQDTIELPYEDRRRLLTDLVEPGDNWMVPAHRVGDGAELVDATIVQGLEGVMAKRLGTVYQPGKRTPNWRKVKNRLKVEVVIGGYTDGHRQPVIDVRRAARRPLRRRRARVRRRRRHRVQSTDARRPRRPARRRCAPKECPFEPPPPREYLRGATWVEPVLRATVEIAEFTNDGFVRHSSFIELAEP